jgi:hypothetical protein
LELLYGIAIIRLAFVGPGVAFDPQSGAFPMPPILSKPSGAAPTKKSRAGYNLTGVVEERSPE